MINRSLHNDNNNIIINVTLYNDNNNVIINISLCNENTGNRLKFIYLQIIIIVGYNWYIVFKLWYNVQLLAHDDVIVQDI